MTTDHSNGPFSPVLITNTTTAIAEGRRDVARLAVFSCGAACSLTCRLAELLTGHIDQRQTPTLLWKALKVCLDEYLDGCLACSWPSGAFGCSDRVYGLA